MPPSDVTVKLPTSVLWYWLLKEALVISLIALIPTAFLILTGSDGWIDRDTGAPVPADTLTLIRYSVPLIALGVYALVAILTLWYFSNYSYKVGTDRMSVHSGIIVTTDKTVQFEEAQNSSIVRGPLLAIFGLARVKVFTASPAQIVVTRSRNGVHTRHIPDVDIILTSTDAIAVNERFASSIQRVSVTHSPAAPMA